MEDDIFSPNAAPNTVAFHLRVAILRVSSRETVQMDCCKSPRQKSQPIILRRNLVRKVGALVFEFLTYLVTPQ